MADRSEDVYVSIRAYLAQGRNGDRPAPLGLLRRAMERIAELGYDRAVAESRFKDALNLLCAAQAGVSAGNPDPEVFQQIDTFLERHSCETPKTS